MKILIVKFQKSSIFILISVSGLFGANIGVDLEGNPLFCQPRYGLQFTKKEEVETDKVRVIDLTAFGK